MTPNEHYAVAKKGSPHESAVAVMRAFISGDVKPSFRETKEAAALILDIIDSLEKKLTYQVCTVHGPVKATDAWCCGKCYEDAVMELESKK